MSEPCPDATPSPPRQARFPVELWQRVLAEDRAAVSEFLTRLIPYLRGVLNRMQRRSAGASWSIEDTLQDALLQISKDRFSALRGWRPDGGRSLDGYLAWRAKKTALGHLRREYRRANLAQQDAAPTVITEANASHPSATGQASPPDATGPMDTAALPPSETDARPALEFWDILEVHDEAQLSAEQKLTLHSFDLSVRELCSEADYDLLVRRFVLGQTIEEVLAARNLEPSQAAALYKHQSRLLLRLREELKKKGYG